MFDEVNLSLILITALIASASPGPATLAIAGTSMNSGRKHGLALAAGITSGSWLWSISAALGLGALMHANAWVFDIMRYFGATYLLFLAFKSARSALSSSSIKTEQIVVPSARSAYAKGLALHVSNPKAILFFGTLFSIGMPSNSTPEALATVVIAVGIQSFIIFHGYALLFSSAPIANVYANLRRWFEAVFALAFGAAGLKILASPSD